MEQNLHWLQEFYASRTDLQLSAPIQDYQIDEYGIPKNHELSGDTLKIITLNNPGWSLKFNFSNTINQYLNYELDINVGRNLVDEDSIEWLYADFYPDENYFKGGGGPLYLTATLELFRKWIEGYPIRHIENLEHFREQIKPQNQLLAWLEEFYFSCGEIDEEYGWDYEYGYDIITTSEGWLAVFSINYLDFENKPFEEVNVVENGIKTRCYKLDGKFIIRSDFRGLIKGISIFKDWVESFKPNSNSLPA
jgi:hypothetical protein